MTLTRRSFLTGAAAAGVAAPAIVRAEILMPVHQIEPWGPVWPIDGDETCTSLTIEHLRRAKEFLRTNRLAYEEIYRTCGLPFGCVPRSINGSRSAFAPPSPA